MNKSLISKETFVKVLTDLDNLDSKFLHLCDVLEDIVPGEYVNFTPNFVYDDLIINLLYLFMDPLHDINFFNYWYFECDRGKTYLEHIGDDPNYPYITDYDELYDFLVSNPDSRKESI